MVTTGSAGRAPAGTLARREGEARAADSRPRGAAVWWLAVRPRTLGASVVPVAVGLALAWRTAALDVGVALVTTAAALLLQIATNLANDYFDASSGVDDVDRLGPVRVTQAGLASPAAVLRGLIVVVAAALACGLYLVVAGGPVILAVGLTSVVMAIAYSAGPWPLSWYGLGDALAFAFFGVVAVCGTFFLQRGAVDGLAVLVSLPIGCLVTALIVVNNLRDIPSDRRAGKRTLAVRLGPHATRVEYAALVGGAYLGLVPIAWAITPAVLAAALTLPLAVAETRLVWRREGSALNSSLAGTARVHLLFGFLLTIGLSI